MAGVELLYESTPIEHTTTPTIFTSAAMRMLDRNNRNNRSNRRVNTSQIKSK